jgi:hypothetical protein
MNVFTYTTPSTVDIRSGSGGVMHANGLAGKDKAGTEPRHDHRMSMSGGMMVTRMGLWPSRSKEAPAPHGRLRVESRRWLVVR